MAPHMSMSDADFRKYVVRKFEEGDSRMDSLTGAIEENTKATDALCKSTEGVVRAFDSAKGAFETLEVIGRIGKPLVWLFGGGGVFAWAWFELRRFFGSG